MSKKKVALVTQQRPSMIDAAKLGGLPALAGTVTNIFEMRTRYQDRCHARETVKQMYTDALQQASRQGERAYAAFERQIRIAEGLLAQGAIDQAMEVLKMGTEMFAQMNMPPALPAVFDGGER